MKALCRMATRSPKRAKNWPATAGVRAISGTSSSAPRPSASTASMAVRYTSVLPLPVTPCSRKVWNWCAWTAARMGSKAACWASFSVCRARTGEAGGGMVSGVSETSPLRASDRAAGPEPFTVASRSLRLCDPGCSSRNARSSRSGLFSLWPAISPASSTRNRPAGARSGSRSVCTCSDTMKPLRSSDRTALSASGRALASQAAESGRRSSSRSTSATGSPGAESSSSWRAASRPESVSDQIFPRRISAASGSMPRNTSPSGAQ